MSRVELRILSAAVAIAGWMVLLFLGWSFGGLVHLLLVAGIVAVPWKNLPGSTAKIVDDPQGTVPESRNGYADESRVLPEETAQNYE